MIARASLGRSLEEYREAEQGRSISLGGRMTTAGVIAEFPATLNRATTRLEVVSELVESPEVTINQQILKQEGQPDLVDDGLHRCTEQRRNGWCGRNCSSGR